MMRMATTVDDTVMLSKSMVAEWLQDALSAAKDEFKFNSWGIYMLYK